MNATEINLIDFLDHLNSPELGAMLNASENPFLQPTHGYWSDVVKKHEAWLAEGHGRSMIIAHDERLIPDLAIFIPELVRLDKGRDLCFVVRKATGIGVIRNSAHLTKADAL